MGLHRNLSSPYTYGRASLGTIADGIDGVRDTLALMRDLVRTYKTRPEIRALAESIISDVPAKDFLGEISAVFEYVRANIRYTLDINEVEMLKDPITLLESGFGDCDDMATLLATLLESVGHRCRFLAVGFTRGELEHVYVQTWIGGTWLSLDSTENEAIGWQPPRIQQRLIGWI